MSYTTVSALMTAIANVIRGKEGSSAPISHQDFPDRIATCGMSWAEFVDDLYNKNVSLSGNHTLRGSCFANTVIETFTATGTISIGASAFNKCKHLESVSIQNCTQLGDLAFQSCTALKSINLNCPSVMYQSFAGCTDLETATFPSATLLDTQCLHGCASLSSVSIPNVTEIKTAVFYNCSALQTLTTKATKIGNNAFTGSGLSTITLTADSVCELGTNAFGNTPIGAGTGRILVKADLINQYKTATNWAAFASQIEAIPS